MIPLITVDVGAPSNIVQQAFLYALNNCPEGPVAQFYYLSAKLYRCISDVVNSLPPFMESVEDAGVPSTGERISIEVVKAEVDEMVRKNILPFHNATAVQEPPTSGGDDAHPAYACNNSDKKSAKSFDFVNCSDIECSSNSSDDVRFFNTDGSLPAGIDEFMELLVTCAKEVELQC